MQMVRVISISDEVYFELSRMKNGKSFTQLLKTLISECQNKGDAKNIVNFLIAQEPLTVQSEKNITEALENGRNSSLARSLS